MVQNATRFQESATYPTVVSEKDGVALYVSVDDALGVEDRQRLKDGDAHRGYLLLVHSEENNTENKESSFYTRSCSCDDDFKTSSMK